MQRRTGLITTHYQPKGITMLSRYYKSIIAGATIVGTTLGTVAADPDIAGVLPTGWGAAIAAGGTVVGTWLVWLKRNEPTVTEAEEILQRAQDRAVGRHARPE
ncbi:hypothetical protein ACQI4L_08995 [Mycolicibacterium litorale]|uniref:hypothetical protein n=1 Tax=Mycolicibacterium litorale TaxID=758802 RepID=UPI003CF1D903